YARNVLEDVPGSNFDEVKENRVPEPASIATTVQSDRKVLAELAVPDGSKENMLASTNKQDFETLPDNSEIGLSLSRNPSPSGSPNAPLKQLELRKEETECSGKGRGQPLSTIFLRRKSIVEVSPPRETVVEKENGEAEVLSPTKMQGHVSLIQNVLADSGKQ
ncbi:hypothetical protein MPER_02994, partial [Moniliophthora perniciosa FA553]